MGMLIYYAYRMFVPPTRLEDRHRDDRFESNNTSSGQEDEYIDYEEVD